MEKYGIIFLMEKIIITATAESIEQVKQLLEAGVDRIYVGEKDFGLRLPTTFSHGQLREIAKLVHDAGKELIVAVNALMHQDMMDRIKPFLDFLEEIKTDYITIGDAGVFYVVNRDGYSFKTIYDASTMVTSSRQINFWGQKAGASEAVLAREIPSAELFKMPEIWKFLLKFWFTELALFTILSVRSCKITITSRISMMKRLASVTSSWLSQVTQRVTIPFLKTIMEPTFLPTMTLI